VISVRFRPKADVVEIPDGLSLSNSFGETILELIRSEGSPMFLRRYERRSGGRRRTYWALVESVRTGRGSRQRLVAYLGELKPSEQSGWAQLGRKLSGKRRPQPSLFDPPHYDDPSADVPVLVRLRDVRLNGCGTSATSGWRWGCGGCWGWTRCWRS